jgi:hypothetical protein
LRFPYLALPTFLAEAIAVKALPYRSPMRGAISFDVDATLALMAARFLVRHARRAPSPGTKEVLSP